MTYDEAERVAQFVDALRSAQIALERCVQAMRTMPGRGGMPAIMANGTANRIATVLNQADADPFVVEEPAARAADRE